MAKPVYVIYPAARLDGWEVAGQGLAAPAFFDTLDEAVGYVEGRARLAGGARVRLENWFGDTVRVWDAPAVDDSSRP
jgi:hypothetical protein